jgi:ATP-dependent helicase/nuclease subunit A
VRRVRRLSSLRDLSRPADLVDALEEFKPSKLKAPPSLKSSLESLREDVVKPVLTGWAEHLYPIVMPVLVAARDAYRDWRRANGRLNFQDLLIEARNMLRDRPDVRRALQARFTPILVDEFQDTDPIQAEILFYLTGAAGEERDWRRIAPAPGALFVVGDPKQSIYRFRRADIETYELVRKRIEESGGRVVELSTNFRSTPALCDVGQPRVRRPRRCSRRGAPRGSRPTCPSCAHRGTEPRAGPAGLCASTCRRAGTSASPVVLEDADRIGRFIAGAVAPRRARRRRLPDPVPTRADSWARTPASSRSAACRTRSRAAARSPRSRELAALLPGPACGGGPGRPVPFTAALRGTIFGVDDDALYRFSRLAGGSDSPPSPRRRRPADRPRRRDAAARARLADTMPPAAAISRSRACSGSLPLAAAERLGESRAGNL